MWMIYGMNLCQGGPNRVAWTEILAAAAHEVLALRRGTSRYVSRVRRVVLRGTTLDAAAEPLWALGTDPVEARDLARPRDHHDVDPAYRETVRNLVTETRARVAVVRIFRDSAVRGRIADRGMAVSRFVPGRAA